MRIKVVCCGFEEKYINFAAQLSRFCLNLY